MFNDLIEPFNINFNTGEIIFLKQYILNPGDLEKDVFEWLSYQILPSCKWPDTNQKTIPLFLEYSHDEEKTGLALFLNLDFYQNRLNKITLSVTSSEELQNESWFQPIINEIFENESENSDVNNSFDGFISRQYTWGTLKIYIDKTISFSKIIIDYFLFTSVNPSISEKSAPLFSTATGKLKKDFGNAPKSRDLARKYRREEFAKSLGYVDYDSLTMSSVCFFEYQSLNFYFSKNRNTSRILVWNDRVLKIAAGFAGWREVFEAVETERFAAFIEREMKRCNKTGIDMGF